MGMSKDINNLVKEFTEVIHFLQKGYHKRGIGHKISERNQKANDKFSDYWKKITTWISKEMKK